MCGRFTFASGFETAINEFRIDEVNIEFKPSFNIAPTQKVAVILNQQGKRSLVSFRWGLIPSWAKNESIGNRLINARAETIADKRIFRQAFVKRRCLILADGFYEWKKGSKRKVPIYVRLKSGKPFCFAGLWEMWTPPSSDNHKQTSEPIQTCTIITTEPNDLLAEIHNRMPVILTCEATDIWLDPELPEKAVGREFAWSASGKQALSTSSGKCEESITISTSDEAEQVLLSLLKPFPPAEMTAYPVSPAVNNPRNNYEELINPS